MGWKDWPYWLKGGIIGFVCYLTFILFPSILITSPKVSIPESWGQYGIPLLIIMYLFYILISMTAAIPTSLFGALIGWIYGKIKNRNK